MKINDKILLALKQYMKDRGMTGADLAKELEVAVSTTCKWINGKSKAIRPMHWRNLEDKLMPYMKDFKKHFTQVKKTNGKNYVNLVKQEYDGMLKIIAGLNIDPVEKDKLLKQILQKEKNFEKMWEDLK